MFVQVIRDQISDADQVHAALDQWMRDLAPGATGWLGSTAGVTEDCRFIALVRFESADAARRNSDRPEQDRWWTEISKLFTSEVTFRDSTDVTVDVNGDPDNAGFVQFMEGRGTDPDRAKELMTQNPQEWAAFRPDVIGSVAVGHEGGAYTMAMYFTSEAEAGRGRRRIQQTQGRRLLQIVHRPVYRRRWPCDQLAEASSHPYRVDGGRAGRCVAAAAAGSRASRSLLLGHRQQDEQCRAAPRHERRPSHRRGHAQPPGCRGCAPAVDTGVHARRPAGHPRVRRR